jgi:hypothetical protein
MIATLRPRMKKMKLPLSKTEETTDSRTDQRGRTQGHLSEAIVSTPEPEAKQTGMANTLSTVKSIAIPKRSAGRESEIINHVKTNKDMPTGLKCMCMLPLQQ